MKNHRFLGIRIIAVSCVALLFSCKPGVYLDEIDKTVGVDASVAVPIGRVSFPLKAFLTNVQINDKMVIEPNMEEAARLELKYNDHFIRPYTYFGDDFEHTIKATKRANATIGNGLVAAGVTAYPNPITVTVPIEFANGFDTINGSNFIRQKGRVDKALIDEADFELTITLKGGIEKQASKIKSVVVSSSDVEGTSIDFTGSELRFGSAMQKNIKDFYIYLMKDRSLYGANSKNLTLDICNANTNKGVDLDVKFIANDGSVLNVAADDGITITINFKTISYSSIWGWFNINNKLRETNTIRLEDELPSTEDKIGWNDIKALCLPLAEPKVNLTLSGEVAGPLNLNIYEVTVRSLNEDGTIKDTRSAQFGNETSHVWQIITDDMLKNYYTEDFNTLYTNSTIFNEENDKGQLHKLFQLRPDEIYYDYKVVLREGSEYYYQQRITKDDGVHLDVDVVLPFVFNEGVDLQSPDFDIDLDISSVKFDEPELDIDVEDLSLILDLENTFPLGLKVIYTFLDEQDQPIQFRNITGSNSLDGISDTIYIAAATDVDNQGLPNLDNPEKVTRRLRFDVEELEALGDIAKVRLAAIIQTDSKSYANTDRVVVTQNEGLAVTLKASAALKAVMNLNEVTE